MLFLSLITNLIYYFSICNKFSFLTKVDIEKEYGELRKQYLWPVNRMDTNMAYNIATQWLSMVSMDVKALTRDCNVHIEAYAPEGKNGQHFVPIYWVYWVKPEQEGRRNSASVELFEPTKTILQLRVEDSEYILRKSLQVTNWNHVP